MKQPATYDDLLRLPEHVVGKIVAGELIVRPRPPPPHAIATSALGGGLIGPFPFGKGGQGGWRSVDAPELHLGRDVLVPDLAGWRRERMPRPPQTAFFELAPDWACELLSASTALLDRAQKLPLCLAAGVKHVWMVDPLAQTLEVLRAEGSQWVLALTAGSVQRVRAEPFEALELDLSLLWVPPEP